MSSKEKNETVVLADDHNIVRHAIKTILQEKADYTVIGETGDADNTIDLVEKENPDLLILDLGLPGKSGVEVIYELRQKGYKTKIVVLTMFEDESKIRQAFSAGAQAYTLKNSTPDTFLEALDQVLNGSFYIPERFSHLKEEIEAIFSSPNAPNNDSLDPLAKLSKREREVFYLLAEGMPNRIIAKKLYISPRTVETHRARVIKKLGFGSTADLIRYAIRNNLLSL